MTARLPAGFNGGGPPSSLESRVASLESRADETEGEMLAIRSSLSRIEKGQEQLTHGFSKLSVNLDGYIAAERDRRERDLKLIGEHEGRLRILEGSARESFHSISEASGGHDAARAQAKADELEKERMLSIRAKADEQKQELKSTRQEVFELKEELAKRDREELERHRKDERDERRKWFWFAVTIGISVVGAILSFALGRVLK